MVIVVNAGHTPLTPGKRSPDKTLLEWKWNREVAELTCRMLSENGIKNVMAATDDEKKTLTHPVKVANDACSRYGTNNVLFVSVHVNAAGCGQWMSARGWSVWTTKGQTKADVLATHLFRAAERIFQGQIMRKDMSDGDPDYEADFYVLRKTKCPAVLIENFFMDNKTDLEYLKTDECKTNAARVIVEGVMSYIENI